MSTTTTTKRLNNRPAHSPRQPHITFPGLARVDGSALFAFSPSPPPTSSPNSPSLFSSGPSALASLTGPIEVRLALENPSHATLEVLVRPLSNVPATQAKALAAAVRTVLAPSVLGSMLPRTLVQLVVQILSAGGQGKREGAGAGAGVGEMGVMAAAVNASTLALLNAASVPMRGVVCAVAVGLLHGARGREEDGLVVDPDERDGPLDAEGCFAYMYTRDAGGDVHAKCVWTDWRATGGPGEMYEAGAEVLQRAREAGERGAREVYEAVYASVERMGTKEKVPTVAAVVRKDVEMEEMEEPGEEEEEMEI
ncbi:putative 3' exoribonuclease family, domain 1 [Lyophyllum shimeji]|uniref:3' exoribonuclease family, domain 1 n=1 Tax=Lyophyllum shimeji TaxID=47721 RepID=A0A9P3PLX6_LYOSH|nr:putative 3' exoribonuclease family, domain 1 [Lyophyllum shimeji]